MNFPFFVSVPRSFFLSNQINKKRFGYGLKETSISLTYFVVHCFCFSQSTVSFIHSSIFFLTLKTKISFVHDKQIEEKRKKWLVHLRVDHLKKMFEFLFVFNFDWSMVT